MCERGSPSRTLRANRPRPWTAPAAAVERERPRPIARIGNNPIARGANTYKPATEAVEVIAHLVAIERARATLAPVGAPRLMTLLTAPTWSREQAPCGTRTPDGGTGWTFAWCGNT